MKMWPLPKRVSAQYSWRKVTKSVWPLQSWSCLQTEVDGRLSLDLTVNQQYENGNLFISNSRSGCLFLEMNICTVYTNVIFFSSSLLYFMMIILGTYQVFTSILNNCALLKVIVQFCVKMYFIEDLCEHK